MTHWSDRYTPPPVAELNRVGSRNWTVFTQQAERITDVVAKALPARLGDNTGAATGSPKVLDFGAGVGRVALRLHALHQLPTHVCDINPAAMAYLSEALPQVDCRTTPYEPPLPYADDTFDALYSISIWTHLPPDLGVAWLKEMRRILKPGGTALISTSGEKVIGRRRERGDKGWEHYEVADLQREGVLYHRYPSLDVDRGTHPGVTTSYGLTAHHPDHIRTVWGEIFTVGAIDIAVIDNIQDLVTLTKPLN